MSDSQIRSPIQMIVNNEAIGGNQAAKDNTPVDTAAMSIISLVSSTMIKSLLSYLAVQPVFPVPEVLTYSVVVAPPSKRKYKEPILALTTLSGEPVPVRIIELGM